MVWITVGCAALGVIIMVTRESFDKMPKNKKCLSLIGGAIGGAIFGNVIEILCTPANITVIQQGELDEETVDNLRKIVFRRLREARGMHDWSDDTD